MKDKKTSHRVPLKRKYAIAKKSREHQRRLRKAAKSASFQKRFRQKEGAIPNLWPFKTEILQDLQRKREEAAAEKERMCEESRMKRREAKEAAAKLERAAKPTKESAKKTSEEDTDLVAPPLVEGDDATVYASLVNRAQEASEKFEQDNQDVAMDTMDDSGISARQSTSSFLRHLRRVVERADVIVEVLDACDPQGCRNLEVERMVVASGKRLIFLLNKIDLVPKDVIEAWMNYLRQFHPVVAFKSATLRSSRPITHAKVPHSAISESELHVGTQVVGAPALLTLLKNYSRTGSGSHTKAAIVVGIIGMPNVGKSSVINSLCRSTSAARVGNEAGVTRQLQEINLDSKIKLIDSPGVIMNTCESTFDAVLRNAVKITSVTNPIDVVDHLLKKFSALQMMQLFKVPMFHSTSDFLGHIATMRGKLVKGGALDYEAAAQAVLHDWTSGKISHYCLPPSVDEQRSADKEAADAGLIHGPRVVTHLAPKLTV